MHRQAIEIRQAIARATSGKRRYREKTEYLQGKLALTYRLIAEYSELGAKMGIDGELPEYLAESRRLEQLEKPGEKQQLAIDPELLEWFRRRLRGWFRQNRCAFPWRERTTPYPILIAEIFLTRTRSEMLSRFTSHF